MTGRRVAVMLASLACLPVFAAVGSADAGKDDARVVFRIDSPEITESSALAVSTVHAGLVYTANDSGDSATIYVLDAATGALVGRADLAGVDPVDVEALGAGSDGSLVVADIGDNHSDHHAVNLYSIPQPGRGPTTVVPRRVTLTYDDGPRDAESVLYDAESGRVFVVSKEFQAHVYRTPRDVFKRGEAVLRQLRGAPAFATDATFLADRKVAVIRTYFGAVAYRYPAWTRIRSIDLPAQRQGESLAAPAGADELWVGSEGERSAVLAVPLPPLDRQDDPSTPPSTSPVSPSAQDAAKAAEASDARREQQASAARLTIVISLAALALVLVVGAVRYWRHHHPGSEPDQ